MIALIDIVADLEIVAATPACTVIDNAWSYGFIFAEFLHFMA